MSEINNNLIDPIQFQDNNQNQENYNQPIPNDSLLPVNESHNIYQNSQPIPNINEVNQQMPIDNNITPNNNIFVKPNPNQIESYNNFENNIQDQNPPPIVNNIQYPPIANNQLTNNPNKKSVKTAIIPEPYSNNEDNEPFVISQKCNSIQNNIPFNNGPLINSQIYMRNPYRQQYQDYPQERSKGLDFCCVCGTCCAITCGVICFVALIFIALFIDFITHLNIS